MCTVSVLALSVLSAPPAAAASDLAGLVNPFIGTGSGGPVVGEVDTFPGATVPFGMVQWSPDTPRKPSGGGYWFDDHDITGFSLTHLSGVGCATGGGPPVLPLAGAPPAPPSAPPPPVPPPPEAAGPRADPGTPRRPGARPDPTPRTRLPPP